MMLRAGKKASKQVKFNLPPTTSTSTSISATAVTNDTETTVTNAGISRLCTLSFSPKNVGAYRCSLAKK